MKRRKESAIDSSYYVNCMTFVNQIEKNKWSGLYIYIYKKKLNYVEEIEYLDF